MADGRRIFPEPFGHPPGEEFACQDHTGEKWRFKFHHRVKSSESRITSTSEYIQRYHLRSGDTITVCAPVRKDDPYTISFAAAADGVPWREGEEELETEEEGNAQSILVNRYERDPKNRQAAIEKHGVRCRGCGKEMAEVYGKIAKGYIHVHHVKPISTVQGARPDIDDLVPLCPNCHAIVHLQTPPIPINRLKELIDQRKRPT